MSITPSVTQAAIFTALRAYILAIVPGGMPVVQAQDNRVPMPDVDFVAMNNTGRKPLNVLPVTEFDATSGTKSYSQDMQLDIQVDCYGETSGDISTAIQVLFATDFAVGLMGPDVTPLFASTPQQLPLTEGELQYIDRWTFTASLQYNPALTIPQASATSLHVGIISVDATYPP